MTPATSSAEIRLVLQAGAGGSPFVLPTVKRTAASRAAQRLQGKENAASELLAPHAPTTNVQPCAA